MTAAFEIKPRGPFSLRQSIAFGFGPSAGAHQDVMRLAFTVDGHQHLAGVALRQEPSAEVAGTLFGEAPVDVVRDQVARILSLDADGTEWPAVGERDPVIGRLQAQLPGFRPVLFHSPYESAAWSVISARRPIAQARRLTAQIGEQLGAVFDLEGERMVAFPTPKRLLEVEGAGVLDATKASRLVAVASAALEGKLDAARLRELGPDAARESVQSIPGIGPFYSGLITYRSVGFTDALSAEDESTLLCVKHFYGLDALPSADDVRELAEKWRPYRSWAVVLLRQAGYRAGVSRR